MTYEERLVLSRVRTELQAILADWKQQRRINAEDFSACLVVYPGDHDWSVIEWPKGFDGDDCRDSRSMDSNEGPTLNVWPAGTTLPWREFCLRASPEKADDFRRLAGRAGDVIADLPKWLLKNECEPETLEFEGIYRFMFTLFDLAIANIPGSQLRVAGGRKGGRYEWARESEYEREWPAGDGYSSVRWHAVIWNTMESAELLIQEILLRLDQAIEMCDGQTVVAAGSQKHTNESLEDQTLTRVVVLGLAHPEWTKKQLAEAAGVDPSKLSRTPLKEILNGLRPQVAEVSKGFVVKDKETGMTDVVSISGGRVATPVGYSRCHQEDEPRKSRLVDGVCAECGERMRVNRSDKGKKVLCKDCDNSSV